MLRHVVFNLPVSVAKYEMLFTYFYSSDIQILKNFRNCHWMIVQEKSFPGAQIDVYVHHMNPNLPMRGQTGVNQMTQEFKHVKSHYSQ